MLNKVMLIGNLGADPEIRYTPNGTQVATLNVATGRKWKGGDGNIKEETEWHRVIVWAGSAENFEKYLTKGNKVYVEGRIQTRKWQDNEGKDRYSKEIVATSIQGLTPRPGGGYGGHEEPPLPPDPFNGGLGGGMGSTGGTGDDVPF